MFRAHVLIVRMSKLYYTASGIITPIGGRPVLSQPVQIPTAVLTFRITLFAHTLSNVVYT